MVALIARGLCGCRLACLAPNAEQARWLPTLIFAFMLMGCFVPLQAGPGYNQLDIAARTLQQRAKREGGMSREQVRAIVASNIGQDRHSCVPSAAAVLTRPQHDINSRIIAGSMPHYGVFSGPMKYRVGVSRLPSGRRVWLVMLNVAIDPPAPDETLELPDCRLHSQLDGPKSCQGTAYENAPGTDACPASGRFTAPASRANVRALLAYWSSAVEQYYNRDAAYDELPVRYDFHFFLRDDAHNARRPVDLTLALHSSCARLPYFEGLRAGWSVPIVAHEVAHFLGLLDEYEPFSGITQLYPKTPFAGSETSRMGLSMKTDTHFFPLHHYLILRRFHCEPERPDPFTAVLQ